MSDFDEMTPEERRQAWLKASTDAAAAIEGFGLAMRVLIREIEKLGKAFGEMPPLDDQITSMKKARADRVRGPKW